MTGNRIGHFTEIEKEIFYKIILSRRDVRRNFTRKKISDEVLLRILTAAHHAPSVGYSQPWNFILIRDRNSRLNIKESFSKERLKSVELLEKDKEKKRKYLDLKLEGILESNLNICVTYDHKRFGPYVIGRMTIKEAGIYSVCCAIQNLWLAARAENIGVGWVSIIDNKDLKRILNLPSTIKPIAYLCLGYVNKFEVQPDLQSQNWLNRLNLEKVINYEQWDASNRPTVWEGFNQRLTSKNAYS
ncbi:MAG: 5,6-dimethylbenzimidazole synthase [Thermoproteota archaeon]|nr:5,6-dimethylbenzimidazole synthase [Thermoproteota archaeon]